MSKLLDTIKEDMKAIEPLFIEEGSMPPVLVFHIPKANKEIVKIMNSLNGGKVKIKSGFVYAIADPVLAENRGLFFRSLATVMGAMVHLKVLNKIETLVFISEAYSSQRTTKSKKVVKPSDDPDAVSVYLGAGINMETGEIKFITREKKYTTDGNGIKISLSETPDNVGEEGVESPLFDEFKTAYDSVLNAPEDRMPDIEQLREADEKPVDNFLFGLQAAVQFTHRQV